MEIQKDNLSPKYILKKELGIKDPYNESMFMDYTKTSNSIFSNTNDLLSPQDKFVLLILLKYQNREGHSFPNEDTIAEIMSCSEEKIIPSTGENKMKKVFRSGISKSIKNLEINEYITVVKNKKGYSSYLYNTYLINKDKIPDTDSNWEKIPNSLVLKSSLTWQQRLFAIQLYPFVLNEINEIHYPKSFLSKKMGLSYPTMCSKMKEFENLGLIERLDKGYRVDVFKMMEIPEKIVRYWINKYQNTKTELNCRKKQINEYKNKTKYIEDDVYQIEPEYNYIDDDESFL